MFSINVAHHINLGVKIGIFAKRSLLKCLCDSVSLVQMPLEQGCEGLRSAGDLVASHFAEYLGLVTLNVADE